MNGLFSAREVLGAMITPAVLISASGTLVLSTDHATVVAETGGRRDARTADSDREPAGAGAGRGRKSVLDLPDVDGPKRDPGELVN